MTVPFSLDCPPLTNCQTWAISAANFTEVCLCEIECGRMGCARYHGRGAREKITVGEPIKKLWVRGRWMHAVVWEANKSSSVRECHMLPWGRLARGLPRTWKKKKKKKGSWVRWEWLVSISADITCVWPSHFLIKVLTYSPASVMDRWYDSVRRGNKRSRRQRCRKGGFEEWVK